MHSAQTPRWITKAFKRHSGLLSHQSAAKIGIHSETLRRMVKRGILTKLSRGLYQLADAPFLGNPDHMIIAAKVPSAILCRLSALAYHGLTTRIPHLVDIALPHNHAVPRLAHPPIRAHKVSDHLYKVGVERHKIDGGLSLLVYGPERAVVDAFRNRHKDGEEVAVEALRNYLERKRDLSLLLSIAKECQGARVMSPYLAALA